MGARRPAGGAIPGQLSPNFNIKELAKRLERLRKLGGDRPVIITSAYRTKAYNASLTGSASNSAHTRGFAVDTPAPRGVTLLQHEQHVLQAFECGVGYYPPSHGNFVHGDFDRTLGGRRRWGH